MDAVQAGQSFTVTRDGHEIGELIPPRRRGRFVPREECAAVVSVGRGPRRRVAGLMIASTAIAEGLPLFTTNPDDFKGLDDLLTVVPVARPAVPHER